MEFCCLNLTIYRVLNVLNIELQTTAIVSLALHGYWLKGETLAWLCLNFNQPGKCYSDCWCQTISWHTVAFLSHS